METFGNAISSVVTVATSIVVIVCCFIYLGFMSIYALAFLILFLLLAVGIISVVNSRAEKVWSQTRDIQNTFFKFLDDLVRGFKELNIHFSKRTDFKQDMEGSCDSYRQKRINGEIMFANGAVLGQLLTYFVVGLIVFIFPLVFKEIQADTLRNYVFIFLFLVGPIANVVDQMPKITQMKISWKRIKELEDQITLLEELERCKPIEIDSKKPMDLKLKDIEYSYKTKEQDIFTVGPVDCSFKSGEITFITGGNGSGKSTLAKVLTGLYTPDAGKILINEHQVNGIKLGEYVSAIYSDFYLFKKLYGIKCKGKEEKIQEYLKILKIEDKVKLEDGEISTIKLSSGQRKRLALLISYLDDRPVYLFDEWAADQDPEFRKYFYMQLLPELKSRGKCVIAITHDDRYFSIADKIIKLERGKMLEQNVMNSLLV